MVFKHRDYWQTNILFYLQADLNANVFTREVGKVRGRGLLNCRTLRISLIQGHRTGTSKRYEGYPITQENVKQRQTGDIYFPAYFVKGQRSTVSLDSFTVFCGKQNWKFLRAKHQLKLNLSHSSPLRLPPEWYWQDRHLPFIQQKHDPPISSSLPTWQRYIHRSTLILFPPPFLRLPHFCSFIIFTSSKQNILR